MQSDIPPVNISEPASSFQHFQSFKTREEAVDFIHKNGGMLVEGSLTKKWIVIRIPNELKK